MILIRGFFVVLVGSNLANCFTNYVWQIESIRKTQCRNLIIGNRYGGTLKRFTSKSPRMILIRGFFRRNW